MKKELRYKLLNIFKWQTNPISKFNVGFLLQLAVYVSSQVPDIVVGDSCRFRQIITNLVGNSIKVLNRFLLTKQHTSLQL